jgi:hypothetical protein
LTDFPEENCVEGLTIVAGEAILALHPQRGETLYLLIDDSKKAKRGQHMNLSH